MSWRCLGLFHVWGPWSSRFRYCLRCGKEEYDVAAEMRDIMDRQEKRKSEYMDRFRP